MPASSGGKHGSQRDRQRGSPRGVSVLRGPRAPPGTRPARRGPGEGSGFGRGLCEPLSAVPTPSPVETGGRTWFGNSIWDALGVVAMLGGTGTVRTAMSTCPSQWTASPSLLERA
ncbi:MAG: organomercurial lyase [Acidimicrobiia bacterium]